MFAYRGGNLSSFAKRLIFAASLAAAVAGGGASPAWGSDPSGAPPTGGNSKPSSEAWRMIVQGDDVIVFARAADLVRTAQNAEVWGLYVYKTPEAGALSSKNKMRFNCEARTLTDLFIVNYDKDDRVLASGAVPPNEQPIVPDTISETLIDAFCGPSLDRFPTVGDLAPGKFAALLFAGADPFIGRTAVNKATGERKRWMGKDKGWVTIEPSTSPKTKP